MAPFILSIGCYSWHEIKPAELPKLNGGAVAPGVVASGSNRGEVVAVSVAHVEAPDGTLLEIKGDFDARVTATSAGEVTFKHPVRSELDDASLTVQGANRARTDFDLEDVEKVEVSQEDRGKTVFVGVLGGALGGLLLAATLSGSD